MSIDGYLIIFFVLEWSSDYFFQLGARNPFQGFSAVTPKNLDKLALEFRKQCRGHAVFCLPSCCCFHGLFSHSPTVFQLIPITPGREFRGAARPTSHSNPNTELQPTGSQVDLLLLDVLAILSQPESKSVLLTFRKTKVKPNKETSNHLQNREHSSPNESTILN